MIRRIYLASACALTLALNIACDETATPTNPTNQNPQSVEVTMTASSFVPQNVSVRVGGVVTWRNVTATAHDITPNNAAQPGVFAKILVPATNGFTAAHTFNTAGTFNYVCTLHAGMTGSVVVQ